LTIVGITGVARSGKDTVAGILCRKYGFTRIGLADGIRSSFRDLDGLTWDLTKELEEAGKSSRWALQNFGSEARLRAMCPDLWLDLVATKITYLANVHPNPRRRFVIPDVRFPSEAATLDNMVNPLDGRHFLWRVVRPGAGLGGPEGQHASEREMESLRPDVTIRNTGPMEYLEAIVSNYAEVFDGDGE
jgi:hypothetical protein